jgi:cyclophilin family peptidyl-prolyl cis-trans isomerase
MKEPLVCVFGQVTQGMDVIDKIRTTKTGPKGPLPKDVPLETVEILSVTRVTP